MKNAHKTVIITTMPISVPAEEAFKCAIHDRILIECICKYSDELRKKDIEVFQRKENVIATSEGYFCAFFEEDIETMEKDPVAFKGKDGRMKVELRDNEGNQFIEDLATLVAKQFVPNPSNLPDVGFRNGDVSDCRADNLFWTENKKEE